MKINVLALLIFITLGACQSQQTKKVTAVPGTHEVNTKKLSYNSGYTTIKWIESVKNIGLVPAGQKAEIQFRFKNTGKKPLFIVSAEPGCGCTIADYPKEAIAPQSEGVITANFDVKAGAQGDFRKNIHVKTNTKDKTDTYIFFYGKVKTEGDKGQRMTALLPE